MQRSIQDWGGNIAAFVFVIIINSLANGLPIGGQTTGEVSAKYPSLFTPAGFTFSIWGLIYLALAVFIIYQALPAQRSNDKLAGIGMLFKLNCLANAVWIFAWHYNQLWLSVLLMAGILGTLIQIFRALGPGDSWLVRFPFSLYTGWITVATIANISALQIDMGWDAAGLTAIQWTWLKLAIAGAIGATVIGNTRDIVYIGVIAWAAYGIYSKQGATPEVAGAAITLSLVAVLLALYTAAFRRA
jgi:benzodiazapine receptor